MARRFVEKVYQDIEYSDAIIDISILRTSEVEGEFDSFYIFSRPSQISR